MAKAAMRFKNTTVQRQNGEQARFRVLGGPDSGVVFVLTSLHALMGRGEENDIVLTDLKVSRKHAEIKMVNGSITIRDLESSHGFMINGTPQRLATLKSGDKIGLGATVLEFISNDAGNTKIMTSFPKEMSSAVGSGLSGLTKFIPREFFEDDKTHAKGKNGSSGSFLERNKKFFVVLGGLLAVATLLPEVERKQRKHNEYLDTRSIEGERGLSSLTPPQIESEIMSRANIQFKEGFRDYREKNYLRAIASFETALQIYSNHALARVYLESSKKQMEQEAKTIISNAKRDEEAYRVSAAAKKYESIMRMYFKDQSNPLYKEAAMKKDDLEKKLKAEME